MPTGWIPAASGISPRRAVTHGFQPVGLTKRSKVSAVTLQIPGKGFRKGPLTDYHITSVVCMPCGEHGRKAGDFFLAPTPFTGLFKLTTVPDDLECAFAINFFLQSPQGTIHWFTFFKLNLCQFTHFLSWGGWFLPSRPRRLFNSRPL